MQNYSFDASSASDYKSSISIDTMLKGTPTTTLEEKMSLLDLASSAMLSAAPPPTTAKNGDSQIQKQNKENLSRGEKI